MIDTLKLTKRLTAAHMPAEQAEALSEGLAESLERPTSHANSSLHGAPKTAPISIRA